VKGTQKFHRIGLAVIGAGYWGQKLLRNAKRNPAFDVRYLCDLDTDRAAQVVGDSNTIEPVSSLEQVFADPSVEAVAIATPAATHGDMAAAAIEAGKHMLVEKPLARNLEHGIKLVRMAEERGLVLMLDHTYCYSPPVTKLRTALRNGELGSLRYWDSVRINLGLVRSDVDVFWDLVSHDISILDSVHPEGANPVAVSAQGADPLGLDRMSVGYLSLRLANGGIAHVHANWLSPLKVRTTIVGGSLRTAVWNDLDQVYPLAIYDRGVAVSNDQDARSPVYRYGEMTAPALEDIEALAAVIGSFGDAIRCGERPLADGRSALRMLAILESAQESLRRHGMFVPLETDFRSEEADER
jgi:predicted dehydrogenase